MTGEIEREVKHIPSVHCRSIAGPLRGRCQATPDLNGQRALGGQVRNIVMNILADREHIAVG